MTEPEPQSQPESAPESGPGQGLSASRPGTVTAAAVVAFILAACEIAIGLLLIAAAVVEAPTMGVIVVYVAVAVLHVAFGGLLIRGGHGALRADSAASRLLLLTAAAASVVIVITAIANVLNGEPPGWLVLLILYGVLAYLLMRPESKRFLGATP